MRKATGCLLKVLGLIVVVLIAALIGLRLGLAALNTWWSSGTHEWKPVPLPGGRQPDHFVITEGPYVYVQSASGVLFVQQPETTTWMLAGGFTPEDDPPYGRCHLKSAEVASAWGDRPPGMVAQALVCEYETSAEMGYTLRYLILSEGEIWLQFRAGMHGLAAMMGMIGFPLVGLLGSALAGCILYGLLLLLRRWAGRTKQEMSG